MVDKKRTRIEPRSESGYISPGAIDVVMKAAKKRRREAGDVRFYFFSLIGAKERWKLKGSIASGLFKNGVRKCFTYCSFYDEKPEGYPDYERVGSRKTPDRNFQFIGGISEAMYNSGMIGGIQKKDAPKGFTAHDRMSAYFPRQMGRMEIGDELKSPSIGGDDE